MNSNESDLDAIRRATADVFKDCPDWGPEYITEELIADFKDCELQDLDELQELDAGVEGNGYGNNPHYYPDTSRAGYVGRFYFYNGSPNRPNDPCGSQSRRGYWVAHSPYGTQYRNCGRFWGYQFSW